MTTTTDTGLSPYLLGDPKSCLVCGTPAGDGLLHLCDACAEDRSRWEGRFTWERTTAEAGKVTGGIASKVGVTHAYFLKTYGDGAVVNYSARFTDLLKALLAWVEDPDQMAAGHAAAECFGKVLPLDSADDLRKAPGELCPNCRVEWCWRVLALNEDRRYGLDYGTITARQGAMITQERITEQAAQVDGLDIEEIVSKKMEAAAHGDRPEADHEDGGERDPGVAGQASPSGEDRR